MPNDFTEQPDIDANLLKVLRQVVSEAVTDAFTNFKEDETVLLDEKETAEFFGLRPQTLALWRHKGIGPAYIKLGSSVRYDFKELKAYLHTQRITR